MRILLLAVLIAIAGCASTSLVPWVRERTGADPVYAANYAVGFEVACDSCRVGYGRDDETMIAIADGSWTGGIWLGTLRDNDRVRVRLRAVPIGEATVLRARILLNGRTVAEGEGDGPGEQVTLTRSVP